MPESSSCGSLVLIGALAALGGLALGAWLGSRDGSLAHAALTSTPREDGDRDASTGAAASDARALRAEIERLREELASRESSSARHALDARALGAAATQPSSAHGSTDGSNDVLDELARLIDSGALGAAFAADPDAQGQFLFDTWMKGGRPDEALRILRAHPLHVEACADVSTALLARGDERGAAEALVLGLERHAEDLDWRDQRWGPVLERLDPAGALTALERWKEQQGGLPDARMDTRRAALLARLGRPDEARRLLDWVWQNESPNELAWTTLGRIDPALAEQRMRATLAGDGALDWDNQSRYMQFLREQHRADDLASAARAWLALPGADLSNSAGLMLDAAPALFAAELERRLAAPRADGDAAELWVHLASAQERLGDPAKALQSATHAVEQNPFDEQASSWMLARNPQRYFAVAEARVRAWNDDEAWGALGDSYMTAGRSADAERAWREARALDPEDGEWLQRESLLRRGVNPVTGEPLRR